MARKGVLSGGALGLNTLCRGCSSHTTLIVLLYPREDKSEKVCTGYTVSHCVIFIIIVIAPTILRRVNHEAYTRKTK